MLNKTHIAIGIFFMFFFIPQVVHIPSYIIVFSIATLLPNLDRLLIFRKNVPRKRGFLHSFTFCLILVVILALFIPVAAFPFFLAYGTHLIVDSWTVEGIMPFWPLRYVAKGGVRSAGRIENIVFYSFIFADIAIIWLRFFT